MGINSQRFIHPELARKYISYLAYKFDDASEMQEFLNTCDLVQAALANLLVHECRYERVQNAPGTNGVSADEDRIVFERIHYGRAQDEFSLVREKLKKAVCNLDVADSAVVLATIENLDLDNL